MWFLREQKTGRRHGNQLTLRFSGKRQTKLPTMGSFGAGTNCANKRFISRTSMPVWNLGVKCKTHAEDVCFIQTNLGTLPA
jgi:hypothetical protein